LGFTGKFKLLITRTSFSKFEEFKLFLNDFG